MLGASEPTPTGGMQLHPINILCDWSDSTLPRESVVFVHSLAVILCDHVAFSKA